MFQKLLAITLVVAAAVSAQANNEYYQIKNVTVQDVTEQYPVTTEQLMGAENSVCNPSVTNKQVQDLTDIGAGISEASVLIDQIINFGQKIWNVIAQGKPVVNLKLNVANALPKGISCWSDLQNWSAPKSKVYQIKYENGFGMTVVDFAFRVTFVPGGNYKGQGKYITNATVQPAHVNVQWGFQFDAQAEVPVVFNQGTTQDPVAALQMNINWKVETAISHIEQTETFYLNGAGVFTKMN